MACNSVYQIAQQVKFTRFPPTYFDLVIADRGGGEITFFWIENCYWSTWNLAHILSNKKSLWIRHDIFYWGHHIPTFSAGNLAFSCFCWIANFIFILLCFSAFCKFQSLFYKNIFVLTFIMGIFYFILVWRGLKNIKSKWCFFSPTSEKSAIKNDPLI